MINWVCGYCSTALVHGGDTDVDWADGPGIETNLSCPGCGCLVLVYIQLDAEEENVFPHP
jgi:hypothetical protein